MTLAAMRVRDACPGLRLGVNVLRNDADAALAVAVAAGAAFVRVNVHVGARVTDQGVIQGEAGATIRARQALGVAGVEVWADVAVKHSAPLGERAISDEAGGRRAARHGRRDPRDGRGDGAGRRRGKARGGRRAVPVPVYVASGATVALLPRLATLSDGVIVGSALRVGGKAGGRVGPRLRDGFARAFREAYSRPWLLIAPSKRRTGGPRRPLRVLMVASEVERFAGPAASEMSSPVCPRGSPTSASTSSSPPLAIA